MNTCTTPAVYIPGTGCNDCTTLNERVQALEQLLSGLKRSTIVKTDSAEGNQTYEVLLKRI